MKMPWKRHKAEPSTHAPEDPAAAIAARVESEKVAERVEKDNAKVQAIANILRSHREENGFGSLLARSLRDVR
jgi:hypothetical protein